MAFANVAGNHQTVNQGDYCPWQSTLMPFTPLSPSMGIKRCVMVEASMRALEERDGFVRYMSIRWRDVAPWLRSHRGISQDKLPLYLAFFEFVHNAKSEAKLC